MYTKTKCSELFQSNLRFNLKNQDSHKQRIPLRLQPVVHINSSIFCSVVPLEYFARFYKSIVMVY